MGCARANSKLMVANSVRSHSGGGEMSRPPEARGRSIRADQRQLVFEILEIEIYLDAPLYKAGALRSLSRGCLCSERPRLFSYSRKINLFNASV